MIRAVVYLVPLRGGVAMAAPNEAIARMRAIGYLLHRRPLGLRLGVLAPAGTVREPWQDQVQSVLRRVASAASFPENDDRLSLGRRWLGVLVVWGGLLLLQADANVFQVVGGLWLVAGFPWVRQMYRRGQRAWAYRPAVGLGAAVHMTAVDWLEHPGLTRLAEIVRDGGISEDEAYRRAAGTCATLGVGDLASVYRALASGQRPEGVWAPMAAPVPTPIEATVETPVESPAEAPAEATLPPTKVDRQLTDGERSTPPAADAASLHEAPIVQEGAELRTSSPAT